jgi:acetyltransferase-like isoleucine patch superfamily enzyme
MTPFSVLVQVLGALLPASAKCALFRETLGWAIGANTRIGLSLILADNVYIGSGCKIGHGNMFRGLKDLVIGDRTQILNFNDFMAPPHESSWPAVFSIGNDSIITSRHYFDCSGSILIGDYVCVGGRDSQFWTHFLARRPDGKTQTQTEWLSIGERCYIGARATLVYCRIPEDSMVGAGAVVVGDFSDAGAGLLLAGNPASIKKRLLEEQVK